jgi:hypothetical protein
MEVFEWLVAVGLLLAGLTAAIGIFLGRRDPQTRPFLPGVAGLFTIGRLRLRPDPRHEHNKADQDKKDGQPGGHRS